MDPLLPSRVAELLAELPRIAVVKHVRQVSGMSLEEAKAFCSAVGDRRYLRECVPPQFGGGSLADRVRLLQKTGDALGASDLVRAETGMSPAEASAFVACLTELAE